MSADTLTESRYSESDRLSFVLGYGSRPYLERAIESITGNTLFRVPGLDVWHPSMREAIDAGITAAKLKGLL
ncbi:MAG: hypothetical protein EPN62_05680 [Candidimonas sp.]|nr:MAG: hypothetical protein EPN77_16735 [Candidimonas sp.]TAM24797.1 MAG: hypothetical protein EPN62_05680 [Candidimonas sp.]